MGSNIVDHLFYMNCFTLSGKDVDELHGLLRTVKSFSDDKRLGSGLDKCAIARFKRD